MTERKPPGVTWETWIDRQIRVGMEEGAFDDLPGTGKPIRDLDRPRDELWWVRDKLRREKIEHLPPTLQVRKELDAARAEIAEADSEGTVRAIVERINVRVRWVNSRVTTGPPSTVGPLDPDAEVRTWREGPAGRAAAKRATAERAAAPPETDPDPETETDDTGAVAPVVELRPRRRGPFGRVRRHGRGGRG